MFNLTAVDERGAPLGALQVATNVPSHGTVWRPLSPRPRPSWSLTDFPLVSSDQAFRKLVITEGADVVVQDAADARLGWLPKPAAQFIELIAGLRPRWTEVTFD
jgi:hypothetical protein